MALGLGWSSIEYSRAHKLVVDAAMQLLSSEEGGREKVGNFENELKVLYALCLS
jgi:hypothetical protein